MSETLAYIAYNRGAGLKAACLSLCGALIFSAAPAIAQVQFATKERAFTQGYSAYKGRQYEIAVPALKFAAKRGVMRGKFYLAKIYSDNSGDWTDHARAYQLLREIISKHANVDPKDFRVARYAAQALTSFARYERDGIKELLKPNIQRALAFFNHAASHFNHADAQFELAKHYLAGDGVEARVPYALNWLAGLSKRGHAGAQAFLANLYWDGRYTNKDPERALALITVAVENAKEEDRFWIEDVHQSIFCESSLRTRRRVHQIVDGWRRRFGRIRSVSATTQRDVPELHGMTKRICSNGDTVGELVPHAPTTPDRRGALSISSTTQHTIESGVTAPPTAPREVNRRPRRVVTPRLTIKMTRIKPAPPKMRIDKRALNGFAVRETSEPDRRMRSRSDKSRFNGFMMQGNTGRGLSIAPSR